jgi:Uma2 family endonuclease
MIRDDLQEDDAMWGLEYALYFGIPNNKLEIFDSRSRWAFPFMDRQQAEAHFANWLETLCRWKAVSEAPAVRKGRKHWKVKVQGIRLELAPLPIDLRIPIDFTAFDAFYHTFWRRDLWPAQAPGRETGYDHFLDHQDVQMNLWTLFGTFCEQYGGQHSGRVGIVLSDTAAVEPDQYYYAGSRNECMIEGDYFQGAPDLIAEVLSPPSRSLDCGPRKELYRRHGVPHLWLLDPPAETLVVYELVGRAYRQVGVYRCGDEFRPTLFPDRTVKVDDLFWTQIKRHRLHSPRSESEPRPEPKPIAEWLVPPETRLGLEYLFFLGHPERRWEIWNNQAPSVLAFGSSQEAKVRFVHFLEEICRWEQAPVPTPASLEPDVEQAEVGRFQLTRRGRHVHLNLSVDARKYRELLTIWSKPEAWDWGEK